MNGQWIDSEYTWITGIAQAIDSDETVNSMCIYSAWYRARDSEVQSVWQANRNWLLVVYSMCIYSTRLGVHLLSNMLYTPVRRRCWVLVLKFDHNYTQRGRQDVLWGFEQPNNPFSLCVLCPPVSICLCTHSLESSKRGVILYWLWEGKWCVSCNVKCTEQSVEWTAHMTLGRVGVGGCMRLMRDCWLQSANMSEA